jgi:anti-sigma B factor antagonist
MAARASRDPLRIEVCGDTLRCRIRLTGELDICTLPRLQTALDDARRDGHRCIELDVSALSFLCASALTVLVLAHAELRNSGGRLVLLNPGRHVQRILDLTDLDDVLITAHSDGPVEHGATATERCSAADAGSGHREGGSGTGR